MVLEVRCDYLWKWVDQTVLVNGLFLHLTDDYMGMFILCRFTKIGMYDLHVVYCISVKSLIFKKYSLSVSSGDWYQDPLWISKSEDAQVPYIKWRSTISPLYPRVPHPQIPRANCTSNGVRIGSKVNPVLFQGIRKQPASRRKRWIYCKGSVLRMVKGW